MQQTLSFLEAIPLVARQARPGGTVVRAGPNEIGRSRLAIIAGPCAVENEEQLLKTARAVKDSGATFLRGGAYKPRTSPYAFQGLREEGLKLLALARAETGLPVVTEVMDARHLDLVSAYADVLQIGSRNMHNFSLLDEVGRFGRPVLLKRGMSATLEEFLLAAERVAASGNAQIILCERGIRTFETATRNTLDLNAVPFLKRSTHLPVIVDPSHGTGHWWMVRHMARAAVAAGCDGLIVEVHAQPEAALSDGDQSLNPESFDEMMREVRRVALAVERLA
ncbi:MAG: 3-deoxy-7-phosphoheptulonate synthase [Acidobacteriota bacterium]